MTSPPGPATRQPSGRHKRRLFGRGAGVNGRPARKPKTYQSCLGGKTVVHSIDGPRTIESMQVGDLVLSQDTNTGELAFRVVLALHRSQPTPTFWIALDDKQETVVATGIQTLLEDGDGLENGPRPESRRPPAHGGRHRVDRVDRGRYDRSRFITSTSPLTATSLSGKPALRFTTSLVVQPVLAPFDRLPESDVNLNERAK